jgi:hypothetical protein
MAVVIPSAGQIGSIYTVPQSDWGAINNRVALAIEVEEVADEVTKYIPNYASLLAACQQWKSQTVPGLISQSVQTSLFATQAAGILTKLATELQPLKANDPLPDSIGFIFRVEFAALQQNAGKLSAASDQITPQINNFVTQNRATDVSLEKIIGALGPGWEGIDGPITSLENAMSDVTNGWSAVQAAFGVAASQQPDLTTAALLALNVQVTINSWNALATTAAAFDSHVTTQTTAV